MMTKSVLTLVYYLHGENLGILTILTPPPAADPATPVAVY